jgi:Flp pilus assembly protein TadD
MKARVPRGSLISVRRSLAALLLSGVLASAARGDAPADPAAPLELAIAAAEASLAAREFSAAEGHYRRALFEGWLLKGTLDAFDKHFPEAREALQRAATDMPEGEEARRSLATAHLQAGDAAQAAALLTPLTAKDPRDVESHRLLAKALGAAGQGDQAVAVLDEAAAALADDPQAAFMLGTEYLWVKRPEAAERLFARVVQARPIPQTHILIGRAYRDAYEYGRARAELRTALLQETGVRRAHYYLGMVALADADTGPDRLTLALAEFQEELRLEAEDPLANDQLGATLIEAGRPAEALPFLETAVRVDPHPLHVYHLARAQLALDRTAEAASTLKRALELAAAQGAAEADVQKMHYELGLALRKLGKTQDAATHLAEARRLAVAATEGSNPDPGGSPSTRAARLTMEGSPLADLPPAARGDLRQRAVGGLARAYLNLGVLQAQSSTPARSNERFAKAAVLFASAAELDPGFPNVQSSLGVAYFNARQFEKAIAPLERAHAAAPDDLGLRRTLAISLLNIESWARAAELLRVDAEQETSAPLLSAYGLALVRGGRGAEAEKVLSRLLAQQGESAELRGLLGEAYAQQGKNDLAEREFDAARRLKAQGPGGTP